MRSAGFELRESYICGFPILSSGFIRLELEAL